MNFNWLTATMHKLQVRRPFTHRTFTWNSSLYCHWSIICTSW